MAAGDLPQADADALLAMEKQRVNDSVRKFPDRGGVLVIPLTSVDLRENFLLDVRRGRVDIAKVTYQNRARSVVVLARLDLAGAPHRNPDLTEIATPHLHLYREGFGDKWAFPVVAADFPHPSDPWATLHDFMRYCKIVAPPKIQPGIFT